MKHFYAFILAVLGLSAAATNHQVQVGSNFFSPAVLSISVGDTVTWTQVSGTHNVNGSTSIFPSNPVSFGNGSSAGGTWTYSFVFTTAGTYTYQCDPHAAMMIGSITVHSLTQGSLAFTAISSDAPDAFQFVVLKPIAGNTVIKFTDRSWGSAGAFYSTTGEDSVVYTAPSAGLAVGSLVTMIDNTTGGTTVVGGGSAVGVLDGISASGDHIFAFQGTLSQPNFIAALGNSPFVTTGTATSTVSYLPSTLTLGVNAMSIAATHIDNGIFQCDSAVTSGTEAVVRASIYNQANWNTNNTLIPTTAWPTCTYSIGSTATGPRIWTIGSLRGVNANGVADSLNAVVRIRGTVTSIDFDGNTGYSFYVQDGTGGMNIYRSSDLANYTSPLRGDSLYIHGTVIQFNGLTEIQPDTITVIAANRPVPSPLVVATMDESNESMLVRMNSMTATTWPSTWSGSGQNVTISNGSTTFTMRIDADCNLWNTSQPTGLVDIIGVVSQFDNSSPFTSGYQLFPRDTNDIIASSTSTTGLRPIGTLRGVNANGVADSLNAVVAITGVVTSIDFDGNTGYSFYIQDATGGINVYKSADLANYTSPLRGDSLYIHGVIDQFNGLTEIVPDSIGVWGTNKPLPTPLVITTMDETNEGELVRMNNMTATTWPSSWSGSGQNVTISDGTNSFTMRIDADCNLWNSAQPAGLFDVLGVVGQFDNSSPYTSGYQLFPRDTNDIIPVVATSPTVRFVGGSATVLEGNVSHTIKMSVQPHLMAAGSVTITAAPGAGFVLGTDATTTPALSGTTLTLPVAAMADTISFTVNILDDSNIEGNEDVVFTLTAASSGLAIGAPSTFTFTIADNDVFIPTYTIPQVKGVDANFLPDSLNVMCKLQGTVLGVNTQTFASTGNVAFTIHDGSVGFGVFGAGNKNLGYTVNEGDVVRIIGTIGHFNGLAQINADSIVVVSTNAALPTPVVITGLDESTESQLIRMNDVTVVNPTQWTNAGSGFTVDITDGVNTIQLRIDADVADVYNAPCPVGTFDVVGIGGQFDNSAPHNGGYQFLPRYLADFIYPVPVTYDLAITEVMASSNDANSAVNEDWFEITNYGSTAVDLAGFSWDDNSYAAGTVVFPSITVAPGEAIVVAQIDAANEAAFRVTWNLGAWVQILVNEDFATAQPGFSANGDGVALFDSSATPIEICRAEYTAALAGFSVEYDTACTYLGNAAVGVRGAYTSTGGDVGSPGNQSIGIEERAFNMRVQPNPTAGLVTVTLPSEGAYTIAVQNLNGQTLAAQTVDASRAQIDLSGLARGMYLVVVSSEAGQSTQRIVLQ